jgi:hypothetical protein
MNVGSDPKDKNLEKMDSGSVIRLGEARMSGIIAGDILGEFSWFRYELTRPWVIL